MTGARQHFAAADEAHYAKGDLREALELYRAVMDAHPRSPEAEQARWQIQHIVAAVVPEGEFCDAQVQLARMSLARKRPPASEPPATAPLALDLPGWNI